MEPGAGRGPGGHGGEIHADSRRECPAHDHTRAARTRSGATGRGCGFSDEVETIGLQSGQGIERHADCPHETAAKAVKKIGFMRPIQVSLSKINERGETNWEYSYQGQE